VQGTSKEDWRGIPVAIELDCIKTFKWKRKRKSPLGFIHQWETKYNNRAMSAIDLIYPLT
jgi:hypothetical protein